jgi:hypothetical protein
MGYILRPAMSQLSLSPPLVPLFPAFCNFTKTYLALGLVSATLAIRSNIQNIIN